MARRRVEKKSKDVSSRVLAIARALRNDALRKPEGTLIGSEEELVERYGVSRPTLRQAASLVSQEQLVYVRRGVGGGYFTRRPDSRSVAHMASIYFRARKATMQEVITAVEPIRAEICRLAARSENTDAKKRLARFVKAQRDAELGVDGVAYRAFLAALRDFGALTAELSANEPLALFQNILYDFCGHVRREDDLFAGDIERMSTYHTNMLQLGDAIVSGDEQLAMLAGGRGARLLTQWLTLDLGRGVSKPVGELSTAFLDPADDAAVA